MDSTLCLDFGNSRYKYCLFEGNNIMESGFLTGDIVSEVERITNIYNPSRSILSSVVVHDKNIEAVLAKHTKFHLLSNKSILPFTTPVAKPSSIGADRLAICAASVHRFPTAHRLSIGLGTCITYNFIDIHGQFLGGGISPGMQMRFRAMNNHTALLPLVEANHQFPLIGYDTATNLQSGVLLGMATEIDGTIEKYRSRYNKLKVLITGGDMQFFKRHLSAQIHYEPGLIFYGLYKISTMNG